MDWKTANPAADDDFEGIVDAGRLLEFLQRDPDDMVGLRSFGLHLLERAPASMLARVMLVQSSSDAEANLVWLSQAMEIGLRRWRRELAGQRSAPDWVNDHRANLLLVVSSMYGDVLAAKGRAREAADCLRLVGRLDPEDRMALVDTFFEKVTGSSEPSVLRH